MKNPKEKLASFVPRAAVATTFAGALLIGSFILITTTNTPLSTSPTRGGGGGGGGYHSTASATPQVDAILHYATSRVVPQQTLAEIRVSFDVLRSLSPCNFLVFGLGHDSLMWSSFNPTGTTLFLEEDPRWIQTVLRTAPHLRASTVRYATRLSQAGDLLRSYPSEPDCLNATIEKSRCSLALTTLPKEVYETEWDLIMIDAPRGYFPSAPGRMGAIYTAAAMARARVGRGVTHVFVHDVNRRIEKVYAEEFLCKKYLRSAVGRLWHFEIPPAAAKGEGDGGGAGGGFC